MIWTRFRRPSRRDTIAALYGMIVAQARSPVFYREFQVPDTVNGRFDMVVLHLAVVLHRLRRADPDAGSEAGPGAAELAQGLFDAFCRDMDGNLREMGIGDLKVPKEMRRIGEAFYGRAAIYDAALAAAGDDALVAAIGRNIYGGTIGRGEPDPPACRLAGYIRTAVTALAAQDAATLAEAGPRFPDPAAIP